MIIARNQENVSMSNRLRTKKGASKTNAPNKNFFEKITLAKVLFVASIIVSAFVFYGSYTAVQTVLDVPVNQVDVEGSFQYLKQEEVHQVINNYVVNGFVSVDLKKLRAELLELPWVYKASIKRKLPNGLLVTLLEQTPVAFWNEDAMINGVNELFFPSSMPQISGLPYLKGKNHHSVMVMFDELKAQLPVEQQPIKALSVSETNVINVVISSGAKLIFNGSDLLEKMAMWKKISSSGLGAQLNEVEYVDLRYSNGASVMWKKDSQMNSEKKMGGV
jgi:cell division protein FtsQ